MEKQMWLVYAVAAGLCWGTYVPLVQQGIGRLKVDEPGGKPVAFAAFLCVGVAYFLVAVVVPLLLFATGEKQPAWNAYGIGFATLAGVAGALGALFVIFANRAAGGQDYKLYIAPIIFALAPVLNTVVSLLWHPSPTDGILSFGLKHMPNWKFFVGILLTGAGAALVLYSKEEDEAHAKARPPAASPTHSAQR